MVSSCFFFSAHFSSIFNCRNRKCLRYLEFFVLLIYSTISRGTPSDVCGNLVGKHWRRANNTTKNVTHTTEWLETKSDSLPGVFYVHTTTSRCVGHVLHHACSEVCMIRANWRSQNLGTSPIFTVQYCPSSRAGIAQSIKRLATGWTVGGSYSDEGEIFHIRPDRPWGPPSLLYNRYRVFPGGKAAGAWR